MASSDAAARTAKPSHTPGAAKPGKPNTLRRLNLPLVAGTLVAMAILAPALYFWHGYQVRRTSEGFLLRAESLAADQRWQEAAGLLHRYLQLNPQDAKSRIRLAETYDKLATDPSSKHRAAGLYYEALGVAAGPNQTPDIQARQYDLRRRLVELQLELRQYTSAAEEANKLLAAKPEDAEVLRLLAMASYGELQSGALVGDREREQNLPATLLRALARNPGCVELTMAATHVLREETKLTVYQEDADACLAGKALSSTQDKKRPLSAEARNRLANDLADRMVKSADASASAYLARHQYRSRYGLPGAVDDLKQALARGPKDIDVLLAAAEHVRQRKGGLEETAESFYQRVVALAPSNERAYAGWGDVYAGQGNLDRAIATWEQGLKQAGPESIDLNLRLADALIARGRLDEVRGQPQADRGAAGGDSPTYPLDTLRRVLLALGPRLRKADRIRLERAADLLEAKWLVAKGEHAKAIALLQWARGAHASSATETAQLASARLLLSNAYGTLGQWDQAASVSQEAAALKPDAPEIRVSAAANWLKAGQVARAVRELEQAVGVKDAAATRLLLAQARLQEQLALPESERNWKSFVAALEEVKRRKAELAEPWRAVLLEAQYLLKLHGRDPGTAGAALSPLELLRKAENDYASSPVLLEILTLTYQRLGQAADADRALAKYVQTAKDPVAVSVVRATLLGYRRQYAEARRLLRERLPSAPLAKQIVLRSALVQVESAAGNLAQAKTEVERLQALDPANPRWLVRLADLAFEAHDLKEVERWEKSLRDVEGAEGTSWKYYRARRLAAEISAEHKGVMDPRFIEAEQLRADLLSQRPSWAASHLLSGLILELRGRAAQAVEAYSTAVRLGATEVNLYERILSLLYGLRQFNTADQYLAQFHSYTPSSSDQLLGWESRIAAGQASQAADPLERQNRLERAIAKAERQTQQQPKDPMAWIWLGQLRLAAAPEANVKGRVAPAEEAEKAFQEAVRLAPEDVRTYNGLFSFYVRTAQRERAQETLRKLAAQPKVPAVDRALALGAGYEMLGDAVGAKAQYQEAERLEPNNVQVKQRLAALLVRTDRSEAERVLRSLRRVAPDSEFAKQNLAQVLASRAMAASGPDEERLWSEVEELLGGQRAGSVFDRRLHAALLFRRGGRENMERARELLKQLVADPQTATDFDRLLLARIYGDQAKRARVEGETAEANKAFEAAEREYLHLVRRDAPEVVHLLAYVAFLLENGRKDQIKPWHQRLETATKANPQHTAAYIDLLLKYRLFDEAKGPLSRLAAQSADKPLTVALRARWLRDTGSADQIEPMIAALAKKLLQDAAGDPQREAAACSTIGNLYASVDQHQQAQTWYQRAVKLVPKNYPALAISLARQGQVAEAIQICSEAAKSEKSPRPALAMAAVLVTSKPTKEEFQLADPMLAEAAKKYKDKAELLEAVANVRVVQGRLDEATQIYRQAVQLSPRDVTRLNNLATLLAEQSATLAEGLTTIDRAIEIAGPQANLLDTKGTLLVFGGRAKEAVYYLQTAVSGPSPDPRYYLHLAAAQDGCGRTQEARSALQSAIDGKLANTMLTAKERQLLADLQQRLLKSGGQ